MKWLTINVPNLNMIEIVLCCTQSYSLFSLVIKRLTISIGHFWRIFCKFSLCSRIRSGISTKLKLYTMLYSAVNITSEQWKSWLFPKGTWKKKIVSSHPLKGKFRNRYASENYSQIFTDLMMIFFMQCQTGLFQRWHWVIFLRIFTSFKVTFRNTYRSGTSQNAWKCSKNNVYATKESTFLRGPENNFTKFSPPVRGSSGIVVGVKTVMSVGGSSQSHPWFLHAIKTRTFSKGRLKWIFQIIHSL